MTVVQIGVYSPCDALIWATGWPFFGQHWPLFAVTGVTDVADVTRHTDFGHFFWPPQKIDPDFSLELQRKVGVAIFCEIY